MEIVDKCCERRVFSKGLLFSLHEALCDKKNQPTDPMESYLYPGHYDLVTPDGKITKIRHLNATEAEVSVYIEGILPIFVGFEIDKAEVLFNFKSALAQLGLDSFTQEIHLDKKAGVAEVTLLIKAIGPVAAQMLKLMPVGGYIGKLFAADKRRRVRDPEYLLRMFGRSGRDGTPLLSLGGMHGSDSLFLEKVDGRTVAYLSLLNGIIEYDESIYGLLPTIAKALCSGMAMRDLVRLHQVDAPDKPRMVKEDEILLVHTQPLHIATVYGMVVNDLLPQGFKHTSANVLQPDTAASGDIYELFGNSMQRNRRHPARVLHTRTASRACLFLPTATSSSGCLEKPEALFKAFATAPQPQDQRASVFIVKGDQMLNLQPRDWIVRDPTHA